MVATALVAAYTVTPRPTRSRSPVPRRPTSSSPGSLPASWDPAAISDAASAQMLAQVYEGLTVLDADAQLRPALAESWTVADDGLSATFRLRPGPDASATGRRSRPRTCGARGFASSTLSGRARSRASSTTWSGRPRTPAGAGRCGRGRDRGGRARPHRPLQRGPRRTSRRWRPSRASPSCRRGSTTTDPPERVRRRRLRRVGRLRPDRASSRTSIQLVGERGATGPARLRSSAITVLTDIGGRSPVDVYEDGAVDWIPVSDCGRGLDPLRLRARPGPSSQRRDDRGLPRLRHVTPAVRRCARPACVRDGRRLATRSPRSRRPSRGEPLTSLLPPGIAGRDDARPPAAPRPGAGAERSSRRPASRAEPASRRSRS